MSVPYPPLIRSDANLSAVRASRPLVTKGTVTQITNATTAVTLNAAAGVITTVELSTVANGDSSFLVNNSHVAANSVVLVSVLDYTGTGLPIVTVDGAVSGGFTVTVANGSATAALNAVMKISFLVI